MENEIKDIINKFEIIFKKKIKVIMTPILIT